MRKIIGTHCPPIPYLGGSTEHCLLAVLVEDGNTKTQIAYHAIVPRGGDHSDHNERVAAVASRGAKLNYDQAREHWPSIDKRKYQR